ncbi:hypothetical protein, partial [Akkermansia sp.]|uniref:hypothetical protein n=1 Tax=Akkermansia sp. TaxID=1872421 RepID=UPI003A8A9C88
EYCRQYADGETSGFIIRDKTTPQCKDAFGREHKDHRNDRGILKRPVIPVILIYLIIPNQLFSRFFR